MLDQSIPAKNSESYKGAGMAGVIGNVTNNLLGLQQLAASRQEMEQRKQGQEDQKLAANYLRKFQASAQTGAPDYESLNEAIIRSPELSKNVLLNIGIQEKRQGQDAADFISRAAAVVDDPEQFMRLAQSRISYLQSSGRDPKDTISLIEKYSQGDVNGVKNDLKGVGAALANQGYLDKDLYAQSFGIQAPITPVQQAQLDLDKQRIGLQREGLDIQRQGLDIDRLKATQKISGKPLDASDIKGIQQDVSTLLKETSLVHKAAKSLEALKDRGSPLSQTAAVFQFMKSLDPTSAVRETEQGQVYAAEGAAAGLAAKLNKLIGEGGLTKEGFADIVDTSKALANSAVDSSEQQLADYISPYGDTIPDNFKKSIQARVPKRFDVAASKDGRPPLSSFQR